MNLAERILVGDESLTGKWKEAIVIHVGAAQPAPAGTGFILMATLHGGFTRSNYTVPVGKVARLVGIHLQKHGLSVDKQVYIEMREDGANANALFVLGEGVNHRDLTFPINEYETPAGAVIGFYVNSDALASFWVFVTATFIVYDA